jgi:signal transduction histidine kinase
VSDTESFREKISKKLLVLSKEMSELKEMCEEFEKIQSEKTSNKYGLPDRKQLYDTYLKIQSDKIITVVENAIKGAKHEL